jgi:hypothetical protein
VRDRMYTLFTHIQHCPRIPSYSSETRRNKSNLNRKGRIQTISICKWHDLIPKNSRKNWTTKLLDIIRKFIIIAGYKIYLQISVAFLYTNNEQTEKEYRKTIPFTIASKKKKNLGINLTKEVKVLYNENWTIEERTQRRPQQMERPSMLMDW